jgi:hypothetical protein
VVLALGVVEGEDGEFAGELARQDLGDEEAVGQVHSRVADRVGQVQRVHPLQHLSRQRGTPAHCV